MSPFRLPAMKKSRMTRFLPEVQHLHQRSPIYPLCRHPVPCGRYFPRHQTPQGLRIPAIPPDQILSIRDNRYTAVEHLAMDLVVFLFYFIRPKAISCDGRYTYVICYTLDGRLHTTEYLPDNLRATMHSNLFENTKRIYMSTSKIITVHQSIYNIQTPCR